MPVLGSGVFVAPNATVVGDVTLGEDSSVWYQAVLRADIESIVVGRGTNLQDGVIVHLSSDRGTLIGDWVTVGHRAILHACTIASEVLIGMGAIVMDGARVGERSIVGAGALVTMNQDIPPGSLVMGSPARVTRALSDEEQLRLKRLAEKYVSVARAHREWHLAATAGKST